MSTETRKQKEKQNRHNAILQASEKIMLNEGVHALNMDLVAKETELAKGTLYLYFKSKDDILAELSLKSRIMLLDEFNKAIKKLADPVEQIKAIVMANYNFFKKQSLYYELVSLYEVNNTKPESRELQRASYEITALIVGITEKAKQAGQFKKDVDPIQFSICLWGMTVGMIQFIKVRGPLIKKHNGISEKELINTYIGLILNGVKV